MEKLSLIIMRANKKHAIVRRRRSILSDYPLSQRTGLQEEEGEEEEEVSHDRFT